MDDASNNIRKGWTIEKQYNLAIKDWRKRAFVEFYLQYRSMYLCKKLHNKLSAPIILMSAVAGATIFSSDNEIIKYVAASLSITSAIATGILRQMRPGERAAEHSGAMRRWGKLLERIKLLDLTDNKENLTVTITKIQGDMESIFSSQPGPHESAIKELNLRFTPHMMEKLWFGENFEELLQEVTEAELERKFSSPPTKNTIWSEKLNNFLNLRYFGKNNQPKVQLNMEDNIVEEGVKN